MVINHDKDFENPIGPLPPAGNNQHSGMVKCQKLMKLGLSNTKYLDLTRPHKGYLNSEKFNKFYKVECQVSHYGVPRYYSKEERSSKAYNGFPDMSGGTYLIGNTSYAFKFLDLVYDTWKYIQYSIDWLFSQCLPMPRDFLSQSKTFLRLALPELESSWYNSCQFYLRRAQKDLAKFLFF